MKQKIETWYENLSSSCGYAVEFENRGNEVELICGDGSLSLLITTDEALVTATSNSDAFMSAICSDLQLFISENKITSLMPVLDHFSVLCRALDVEENGNVGMDDRDSNMGDYEYQYDDDEGSGNDQGDGHTNGKHNIPAEQQSRHSNGSSSSRSTLSTSFLEKRALLRRWAEKDAEMSLKDDKTETTLPELDPAVKKCVDISEEVSSAATGRSVTDLDNPLSVATNSYGQNTTADKLRNIQMTMEQSKRVQLVMETSVINPSARASTTSAAIFSPSASSGILTKDLLRLVYPETDIEMEASSGFRVEAVSNDIYHWRVKMDFTAESPLFEDLVLLDSMHEYRHVELEMHFARDLYPVYPPLVTVIRPRFKGHMLGRIAGLHCLQLSHWNIFGGDTSGAQLAIKEIRHLLENKGMPDLESPRNSLTYDSAYSLLERLLLKLSIVCEVPPRMNDDNDTSQDGNIADKTHSKRKYAEVVLTSSSSTAAGISAVSAIDVDVDINFDINAAPQSDSNLSASVAKKAKLNKNSSCDKDQPFSEKAQVIANMNSEMEKKNEAGNTLYPTSSSSSSSVNTAWAKGTGYGSGNARGSVGKWNVEAYLAQQKEKDRLQVNLLDTILLELKMSMPVSTSADLSASSSSSSAAASSASFSKLQTLDMQATVDPISVSIYNVLSESCLLPYLYEQVNTFTLSDLDNHSERFMRVFYLLEYMAKCPILNGLLFLPTHVHVDSRENVTVQVEIEREEVHVAKNTLNQVSKALNKRLEKCFGGLLMNTDPGPDLTGLNPSNSPRSNSPSKAKTEGKNKISYADKESEEACKDYQELDAERKETQMIYYMLEVSKLLVALPWRKASAIASSSPSPSFSPFPSFKASSSSSLCLSTAYTIDASAGKVLRSDKINSEDILAHSPPTVQMQMQIDTEQSNPEAIYISTMRDLQYLEISQLVNFHYNSDLKSCISSDNRTRTRHLAKEHADMSSDGLPLNLCSSIWVRVLEDRMDAMQVAISGPDGTPYENGLFIFDVYFPTDYPNVPPKVNLSTTGGGSVRFNPNLYNCGKVCLSLLGTWSGEYGESWAVGLSTLRQVLISIQALILVPAPFFNEPGYERMMGTPDGDRQSHEYSAERKVATLKWAILDQIQKPKAGFEDITRLHFKLKRAEIKAQMERWCTEETERMAVDSSQQVSVSASSASTSHEITRAVECRITSREHEMLYLQARIVPLLDAL